MRILTALLLLFLINCGVAPRSDSTFLAMGGIPVNITLYCPQSRADTIYPVLEDTLRYLDSLFTKYSPDSPVYRFNTSGRPIEMNDYFREILEVSNAVHSETDGLFDIGIQSLISYYERCEIEQVEPLEDSLFFYSSLAAHRIIIDSAGYALRSNSALEIDLGGIAKGYIADVLSRCIVRMGVNKFILDMAGDIVVHNTDKSDEFTVGIRSSTGNGIFKTIALSNGAVMTSGDYYRYYEIAGKKYSHILNPNSGRPAPPGRSVTVISQSGAYADAYATALMLMDKQAIEYFRETHPGVRVIIQ
ncbi:MAG: FAD:protein FMN transferase [candidate division WOR-3 bacterium]|nr:FAD:protein FMN transferase [candidate division WOR-3 bacterium]